MSNPLLSINAKAVPTISDEDNKKDFEVLLAAFWRFIHDVEKDDEPWDSLEDIMDIRAGQMIKYACEGFGITVTEALDYISEKDNNTLTAQEQERVNIIVAAIDNLVDFAVVEEYQMLDEISEAEESDEEVDEAFLAAICAKYNQRYAKVENEDVFYAMYVARQIYEWDNNTILMYMTQGDERVRPWHLAFEGYTAPKRDFPSWLIPPIEHQCRCYLVEDTIFNSVEAASTSRQIEMPEWFNKTFQESVAYGGRIFSEYHPYFEVKEEHFDKLTAIAKRIKRKYYEKDKA
jgi:hypothetical protein